MGLIIGYNRNSRKVEYAPVKGCRYNNSIIKKSEISEYLFESYLGELFIDFFENIDIFQLVFKTSILDDSLEKNIKQKQIEEFYRLRGENISNNPYMVAIDIIEFDDSIVLPEAMFYFGFMYKERSKILFECFDVDNPNFSKTDTAYYRYQKLYTENPYDNYIISFTTYINAIARPLFVYNDVNNDTMHNIDVIDYFQCVDLISVINLEFLKMIQANIKIKRCQNCGKYFVLKGDYDTKYCDRIDNEGISCKVIGARKAVQKKATTIPAVSLYNKMYNKMRGRIRINKISKYDFDVWSNLAKKKRNECVHGQITFVEFQKWLNDYEIEHFKK